MKGINKALYERIMRNISKEVKRVLNEDIQNFNPVDYEDEPDNLIDQETIYSITSLRNIENEIKVFEEIKPSLNSIMTANKFAENVEKILLPLKDIKISKRLLKHNDYDYYLFGQFKIDSNFKNDYVAFEYALIWYNYNIAKEQFILEIDIDKLAKMIQFCSLYKNPLDISFTGHAPYYKRFKYIQIS